jgi:uncharacterized SAM-binding protein YcdF (DUF218 family)
MFVLLTRVLLWLIIAVVIYVVLLQLLPKKLLATFGAVALLLVVILAFLNPNDELVFEAWQVLSIPLTPLGMSLLLILIALTSMNKGGAKAPGRWLIAIALVILSVSSLPFVAYQLAQATEQEVITSSGLQQPSAIASGLTNVIALIGKGTTEANLPYRTQIQLTDTGDRVLYTAQLYQQQQAIGRDPLVIVSAGPRSNLTGEKEQRLESRDIFILLQQFGVDPEQILLEAEGIDLRTSAVKIKEILTRRGLADQPLFVVTSALNTRRAALTFENVGLQAIIRPTDFYTFQSGAEPERRFNLNDFVPSAQALWVTTEIVKEYLATMYYFLRGWLSPTVL